MSRTVVTYDKLNRTGVTTPVLLPLSKSIFAREVIISALSQQEKKICDIISQETSAAIDISQDVEVLIDVLLHKEKSIVDIGASGTALRLLLSFLSLTTDREIILTGSDRIQQRPLAPLIDALKSLGARIECLNRDGFAPVRIAPLDLLKSNEVYLDPSKSSQFVTSLLLIGPYIKGGLTIHLTQAPVSVPYIAMTIDLMKRYGVEVEIIKHGNRIENLKIPQGNYQSSCDQLTERDWSAAAFFYMYEALSDYPGTIIFDYLRCDSLQGDLMVKDLFTSLGVLTTEIDHGSVALDKIIYQRPTHIRVDFEDCPDLMPAWVVTATLLCIPFEVCGIDNLKHKESDRVRAVMQGLGRLGYILEEDRQDNHIILRNKLERSEASGIAYIDTCNDHRIAMAFTMASIKYQDGIILSNLKDVDKSFPQFHKYAALCGLEYNNRRLI